MNCELCNIEHNGDYGSGRFCSKKCACSFSTKENRGIINNKVSQKLRGKWNGTGFKPGFDPNRRIFSKEDRIKSSKVVKDKTENFYKTASFESLSPKQRFKKVKMEQNYKCAHCGLDKWLGNRLVIEIDHVDGDKKNNNRDNLRGLCPNCHSQTSTWRKKKSALVGKSVKSPDLESGGMGVQVPPRAPIRPS